MTQLTSNTDLKLAGGEYVITNAISTGTATLQMSVEGAPFVEIPDAVFSSSDVSRYTLPKCTIKAILTGDATCYIDKVQDMHTGNSHRHTKLETGAPYVGF